MEGAPELESPNTFTFFDLYLLARGDHLLQIDQARVPVTAAPDVYRRCYKHCLSLSPIALSRYFWYYAPSIYKLPSRSPLHPAMPPPPLVQALVRTAKASLVSRASAVSMCCFGQFTTRYILDQAPTASLISTPASRHTA
jgi:hypothetical protein